MSRYEATGGDGRYARLYLPELEPVANTPVFPPSELPRMAAELDAALSCGDRQLASAWVRSIRVCARGDAVTDTSAGIVS